MKLNRLEKYFKTVNGKIVDYKQVDQNGNNPLLFSFYYNREKKLGFGNKQ